MNWKRLDKARRSAGPVELDLIESYVHGYIGRRDFLKRGAVVGLSVPFMGAIVAASRIDEDGDNRPAPEMADAKLAPATGQDRLAQSSGGNLIVGIQQGDPNSGLDPINMLELGTYNVVSQSFEYLVGAGQDEATPIAATALATSWSPNEDGTVWTFNLRPGAKWSDGSPVTSADVAATMDRLATASNGGLSGVIDPGSTNSSNPAAAVITLLGPNGNFPTLVSLYNAQTLITPADYSTGTTLNERPEGSGAWILDDFDEATFVAKYTRNPNWWGSTPPIETIELRGFSDLRNSVSAMQSRDIDVIQQFGTVGGEALLNDSHFVTLSLAAANHRQIWFNTQQGQFTNRLVREALAWTLDRTEMVNTLHSGHGEVANDHPVMSAMPFYDPDVVDQRVRNVDQARALLAEAGIDNVTATCETGDLQEIPQLAQMIRENAAEAGFDITVNTQSNSTFYGAEWCPAPSESDPNLPCDGSAELGIVDWGHRPIPDIYLASGLSSGGVWNSANYANPEFDAALSNYRVAIDVRDQKDAVAAMQKILWTDVPTMTPFFFDYLSGHDASVAGVQATALGHTILSRATKG